MANSRDRRFEYVLDLNFDGYGVYGYRSFRDRNSALAFAESLALNNPDVSVAVNVEALGPRKKNVLRQR